VSNIYSIFACVFVTAVTFLQSRCLATKGGYTDTQTDGRDFLIRPRDGLRWRDIRTKFHKDLFRCSKVNKGGYTDTHANKQTHEQQRDLMSLLYFFKIGRVS
jgi:hypothetical protein